LEKYYVKVIVCHLPLSINDEEFEELFPKLKNDIVYCNLAKNVKTKNSIGYGFVYFESNEVAKKFIEEYDGMIYKNKRLFFHFHFNFLILILILFLIQKNRLWIEIKL
jgi:RNA recognition motif-containing protein